MDSLAIMSEMMKLFSTIALLPENEQRQRTFDVVINLLKGAIEPPAPKPTASGQVAPKPTASGQVASGQVAPKQTIPNVEKLSKSLDNLEVNACTALGNIAKRHYLIGHVVMKLLEDAGTRCSQDTIKHLESINQIRYDVGLPKPHGDKKGEELFGSVYDRYYDELKQTDQLADQEIHQEVQQAFEPTKSNDSGGPVFLPEIPPTPAPKRRRKGHQESPISSPPLPPPFPFQTNKQISNKVSKIAPKIAPKPLSKLNIDETNNAFLDAFLKHDKNPQANTNEENSQTNQMDTSTFDTKIEYPIHKIVDPFAYKKYDGLTSDEDDEWSPEPSLSESDEDQN
jgi:hypothetical protein